MDADFKEIGHSGGKITFRIMTDEQGTKALQIGWQHDRPTPAAIVGIYALEQGIPVASFNMGGIGQGFDPPPPQGCFPVFLCSDSHGKFGHKCPRCMGYWRSSAFTRVCPYCRNIAEGHHTLSDAQHRYVDYYCKVLREGLSELENGEIIIDMNAIADAVDEPERRPGFYISEEQQQNQFHCSACGQFNDVIGIYAFCSSCGTRNDTEILKGQLTAARERLNKGGKPEDCLRDLVSYFDSFIGQMTRQLVDQVPLSNARKARLQRGRFHKLEEVGSILKGWFDIDAFKSLSQADVEFTARMFLRRHVYEHNGGEVDQNYLLESGDNSVRLKQILREKPEDVHRLVGLIDKIGRNVHAGFEELFPPFENPIKAHKEVQERIQRSGW